MPSSGIGVKGGSVTRTVSRKAGEVTLVGFVDRRLELVAGQAGREVDQRENRWGNGDAVVVQDLQLRALMNHDPGTTPVVACRDLDAAGVMAQPPVGCGSIVAEGRLVSTAQYGSHPHALPAHLRAAHRINAVTNREEASARKPMLDPAPGQPPLEQLAPAHHAMLLSRQPPDRFGLLARHGM